MIAVAHNRAASSNLPERDKDKEAHPFINETEDFVIVHNGGVANDTVLRNFMEGILGHKFSSGVDSEVYLHIIEELLLRYKNRNEAIKELFKLATGNLLILFKDGSLYGIPGNSFFYVSLCDNTVFISSEVNGLKEVIEDFEDIAIWKLKWSQMDDQLVRIYMKDGLVQVELFGDWEEIPIHESWIGSVERMCDFCKKYHQVCEEVEINGESYDRCLTCFKNGIIKPKEPKPPTSRSTSTTNKKTYGECAGINNKHKVDFEKLLYCPNCNNLYCKGCYFNKRFHKCEQPKSTGDAVENYHLGHGRYIA